MWNFEPYLWPQGLVRSLEFQQIKIYITWGRLHSILKNSSIVVLERKICKYFTPIFLVGQPYVKFWTPLGGPSISAEGHDFINYESSLFEDASIVISQNVGCSS